MRLGPRRGVHAEVQKGARIPEREKNLLERLDLAYRTLCAILYNFVPRSGHPGGSISMGRIVEGLLFGRMAYDVGDPTREDQDLVVLAAGHKAMGLYAMLALRDEVVRIARPEILPREQRLRLRLEDLLGFRRNPTQRTPLVTRFESKPLDGHPTPSIPFVKTATGPSGVGFASSVGLALGILDTYRDDPPIVHVVEGEGGMTPGRVAEALAAASASRIVNLVLHVDWNQSTIDVDACCRVGDRPGDYVQWDPAEIAYVNDWNVVRVADGMDIGQVRRAQALALEAPTIQPTCVVYRTVKGWRYGIEGKRSHGAGHAFCSEPFHEALRPFEEAFGERFPRFGGDMSDEGIEEGYWEALLVVRRALERERATAELAAGRVAEAAAALGKKARAARPDAPVLRRLYDGLRIDAPPDLALAPGERTTQRGQLGRCLGHANRITAGAVMGCAADLLDSTSVALLAAGMGEGFFRYGENPDARLVAAGGICEDAMGGMMSGLSSFGRHIGVSASYAAFIAPLEHIACRCHAIGEQAKRHVVDEPPNPLVVVMGHSSVMTGEDGPTHADPQSLQLYEENFVPGLAATLTPWEPGEVWPLLAAALGARFAVVACYVTRPEQTVPDRERMGIPPARAAAGGVYAALCEGGTSVVIQGCGVANEFFFRALPVLRAEGIRMNVFYVASAELFDRLDAEERRRILPEEIAREAMGITDFTLPTLYRFVTSERGREASLHPFRHGRYLGSGRAEKVLAEAGLDAASQVAAIRAYANSRSR